MAKNMGAHRQSERRMDLIATPEKRIMFSYSERSGFNGLDSPRIGANSLRHDLKANGAIRKTATCCSPNKRRRRHSLGYQRWTSFICVIFLVSSLCRSCVAFRQDPVASAPARSATRSTLSSQKNVADDVQEGETSRLQRLLPSAWRNKNMSSWEIVESVRSFRGGGIGDEERSTLIVGHSSVEPNDSLPPENPVDKAVGKVLTLLGRAVVVQSVATLLTSNDNALLTELATRLLSVESATAVKTVRTILTQFGDHGVVDVFKEYPGRDVVAAILALSRLQKASLYYAEEHQLIAKEFNDPELLEKLARYAVFAKAAYGWKMDLAMRGRLHLGGDSKALLKQTGIEEEDMIVTRWKSKTHRPAYFLVRDKKHQRLVLSIRGTWSARDILTDLCCTGEDFDTPSGTKHAHHGMLEAARGIATDVEEAVQTFLNTNKEYQLVIVGHSLGGGVAAVLGTLWEDIFPGVHVYAYGCPCVGLIDVGPTASNSIFSVVGEGDPFSCLSLGHIANLSSAIAYLCKNESLRTAALIHSDGPVEQMDEQDLKWCYDTMEEIRAQMIGQTMYPPGRILYISRNNLNSEVVDAIALREMPASYFHDLRLHSRMLDLSRHVPTMYENYLQSLWEETACANQENATPE